jgi:GNAT superfamily N-acetyltransferase
MFPPTRQGVNPTPRIWAIPPGLSPRCCDLTELAAPCFLRNAGVMTPRLVLDPAMWPPLLALLHKAFAYMDGRIDPPSSLRDLTPAMLSRQAGLGEIWIIDATGTEDIRACVFLTLKPDALYVGKLAVDLEHRGLGLARRLIAQAEDRARALGLPALELQTRVELTENQAAFQAMGFVETARTAHPGFDRPTSITYRRRVG